MAAKMVAGEETLLMQHVEAGRGEPGSPVFTGVGMPLVPRGILIGEVAVIRDDDRDGIAEVVVRPAVPSRSIDVVNILVLP